MIKTEQVPDAAADALCKIFGCRRPVARAALIVALHEWSGIERVPGDHEVKPYLILPLPTEASMTDIHIPPAALEAGARAEWEAECARIGDYRLPPWEDLNHEVKKLKLENARAAFVAMVEAWEGMKHAPTDWERWKLDFPFLILPLPPQENSDAER